jgi:hypothetical protein
MTKKKGPSYGAMIGGVICMGIGWWLMMVGTEGAKVGGVFWFVMGLLLFLSSFIS